MIKTFLKYTIGLLVAVLSFGLFFDVAAAASISITDVGFQSNVAQVELQPTFDSKDNLTISLTVKDSDGKVIGTQTAPMDTNSAVKKSMLVPLKVDVSLMVGVSVEANLLKSGTVVATTTKKDLSPKSDISTAVTSKKLSPVFRVTEDKGTKVATLTWTRVVGATKYLVARGEEAGSTDEFITIEDNGSTDPTIELDITDEEILNADLKPSSVFTVTAVDDENNQIVSERTTNPDIATAPTEFGPIANVGQYANNIMQYALPLGVALAILVSIYAGVTLMLSQGEPDKIKSAQEGIQGAVIGLVVLILTRLLADFLYLPELNLPGAVAQQQLSQAQGVTLVSNGGGTSTTGKPTSDQTAPSGPGVMLNVPGVGEGAARQCGNASVSMAVLYGNPATTIPLNGSPFVIKDQSKWTHKWPDHIGKTLEFYSQRTPWPYTNPDQPALCPTLQLLNKYYATKENGNRSGWSWYNDKSFDSIIRSLRGLKKDNSCANPLVNGKCVGDPVVGYFREGSIISNSKHIVTIVGYDPTLNKEEGGTFYINNPLRGKRVLMQQKATLSGKALTRTFMEASAGGNYDHTYAIRSVYR